MKQEYLGMRLSIESGGSIKVTLPKPLIEEIWKKIGEKLIPICYILVDGKVRIEELQNLLINKDYQDHIILAAKQDWMNYALKLKAKQERSLEKRFIEGEISEIFFRQKVEEIREVFRNVNRRFRETLVIRGIRFDSNNIPLQFHKIASNISESEKDENLLIVIEEITKFKDDVKTLEILLEKLNEGLNNKRIPKKLYKQMKSNYESELKSAKWRIEEVSRIIKT